MTAALRAYDARMADHQEGETLRDRILALGRDEGPQKGARFERWLVETLPQIPSTEIARAWRWQDSQADGAYYTLTPGAMLLAELACDLYAPPDDPLWRKPGTWKKIAMMDPACGSGTLLVAFASAVRCRAAAQGAKQKQIEKVHRAFVERGMVGLDINRHAVQIAAAQLTAPTLLWAGSSWASSWCSG